ncbi:MAG TPA: FAD-dependent oxidoreductase [Arachidicoccus sp.]|nr:FAD-dependent oxidoreductase [Arachidicoccus sp.]
MILDEERSRKLLSVSLKADLGIVGGGISGVCAAITAARQGLKVVLVQDRPVLGGNASSEVRLWILGATSHMGNNNRWARESGVIDELLVENTYRNPEGNPVILDMILLEKVVKEPNITLLLNTCVHEVSKKGDNIENVAAFCSQNSTAYRIGAPLFCDASGDGILGFLSGAAFRMGAEGREEFDEPMAPDAEYGELLGHSLYFYSKDTGRPVRFTPPSFAVDVQKEVPRFKSFNAKEHGCKLWWVEYGGRLDTVYDTEEIKWELWKIIYGVWDYIKNSGDFPEAENYTLEWVGMVPGKRESRRFEGDYMLSQSDLIRQRVHTDAVAYGGWSIDLHPADGVYADRSPCNQWHSMGIFQIPYRCLYSRNIKNLFLAGRIISVSHVAFGATRVMATCGYVAQAVAISAVLCKQYNLLPADLFAQGYIPELQNRLMQAGQFIPGLRLMDQNDLVQQSRLSASSVLQFSGFSAHNYLLKTLSVAAAQLLPVTPGRVAASKLLVNAFEKTILKVELRSCSHYGSFTPDTILSHLDIELVQGLQYIDLDFNADIDKEQYLFICFLVNEQLQLAYSRQRISGMLSVFNGTNKAVSNTGKQIAPEGSAIDDFEFWCPERRPEGHNLALQLNSIIPFEVENIRNGIDRPVLRPNAWVASPSDAKPHIELSWTESQRIRKMCIVFDTDRDHPMESILMTHPETVMPFCIRNYHIEDDSGNVVYEKNNNFQTVNEIYFDTPLFTRKLRLVVEHPSSEIPAAIFSLRCYA